MNLIKTHAFGNDFLLVELAELPELTRAAEYSAVARRVCDRHRGVGADGLLLFARAGSRTSMRLLNADGSRSEISGNGLRCLAAWLAHTGGGDEVAIDTEAGTKHLVLLEREGTRYTFTAAMGEPAGMRKETLMVGGAPVEAITLRVGNPQCVLLGEVTEARLHALGAALAVHPRFPAGTNVELAAVDSPGRVRILIWERGVGPTEASGTGACAAAAAAMAFGGADRDVLVESPGGAQRVEWRADGLYLTGWAEIVADVRLLGAIPA